jgi:hypothetical protein
LPEFHGSHESAGPATAPQNSHSSETHLGSAARGLSVPIYLHPWSIGPHLRPRPTRTSRVQEHAFHPPLITFALNSSLNHCWQRSPQTLAVWAQIVLTPAPPSCTRSTLESRRALQILRYPRGPGCHILQYHAKIFICFQKKKNMGETSFISKKKIFNFF